ncbi:AaceriABR081Cp [[Ashbya] aceris (nom. inval.)]|nr:AaceriABR081Cp [[Ashbya] aceris (nom. inval.)]
MSLVSAAVGDERGSGGQPHKKSVYKPNGQPLSKEALYRAQLKYGTYKSPARGGNLGVQDSKAASDKAATTANSNKKEVETYKRMFVDSNASKAASRAGQQPAAARAASGGPSSRGQANPKAPALDISKVLEGAERAASKRIQERINPEKPNFTYGLRTGPVESRNSSERTFSINNDLALKTKGDYLREIDGETDPDPNQLATYASSAAIKSYDANNPMDREVIERHARDTEMFKHLSSQQVLAKARANADATISQLDREAKEKLIFSNEGYNRAAIEIAKKNHAERQRLYGGKVNLGGGLWVYPEEVEQVAQGLVDPVLSDVDKRASEQRQVDEEIARRKAQYEADLAEWQAIQREKAQNDALEQSQAVDRREIELYDTEETLQKKTLELAEEHAVIIEGKKLELNELKRQHAALLQQSSALYEQERAHIDAELSKQRQENAVELEMAREEEEKALEPVIGELGATEQQHLRLVEEREKLETSLSTVLSDLEQYKKKVLELESQVLSTTASLEEQQKGLQALISSEKELEDDINNNLSTLVISSREEASTTARELQVKEHEAEAVIKEHKADLARSQQLLEEEKQILQQTLSELNQLKEQVRVEEPHIRPAATLSVTESTIPQSSSVQQVPVVQRAPMTHVVPSQSASTGQSTVHHTGSYPSGAVQGSSSVSQPHAIHKPSSPMDEFYAKGTQQPEHVAKLTKSSGDKPSLKQRKVNGPAYVASSPSKKDSALGRFFHKLIPSKKSPSAKGQRGVARSSTVPSRKMQTGQRPVQPVTSSNQSVPRHLAREVEEDVDTEEVRDLLETQRATGGKLRKGSLFKEVF